MIFKGMWNKFAYNVGGLLFTLDEIEHGILRCNKGHPKVRLIYTRETFNIRNHRFRSTSSNLGIFFMHLIIRHFYDKCKKFVEYTKFKSLSLPNIKLVVIL